MSSVYNTIMYLTVAAYSIFLIVLATKNIFGKFNTGFDSGFSMSNDAGEALVRGGMFVSGVVVFLVSFAYMIPIKEIIQKSFAATASINPTSIIAWVVCAGGGALSSSVILSALKEKDDRAIRMLLFLVGLLLGAIGYSYTIAFEADTPEGKLKTEFLPSLLFVIGSMIYAGLKYQSRPNPEPVTDDTQDNTSIYANAVSVIKGETFTDPHTGLIYELTDIQENRIHPPSYPPTAFFAIAYLTVPEDIASKRRPTAIKEGQSINFTFQNAKYMFIVERITLKADMVDIRVVQTR